MVRFSMIFLTRGAKSKSVEGGMGRVSAPFLQVVGRFEI